MKTNPLLFLVLALSAANAGLRERPLTQRSQGATAARFTTMSVAETGLDFVNPIETDHPLKRLYVAGYAAGGLAIGDLDGDGLQDLFCVGAPGKNVLYRQKTNAKGEPSFAFEKVLGIDGLDGGDAWGAGVAMADIDNDGDLDLYVTNHDAANQCFINETKEPGKLVLVERAKELGVDLIDACFQPSFCDYDLDGDLDLYVLGYQFQDPAGRPKDPPVYEKDGEYFLNEGADKYYGIVKSTTGRPTFTNVGRRDYLLQSNASEGGALKFTDVTEKAGIFDTGSGNSATWWDYNDDGFPDLYVANDFKMPDAFYHNNGDGTFRNIIADAMPHTTWFSMGSDAGDMNNDGRLDLLVSDMAGTTHYKAKVTMGEMQDNLTFLRTAVPRQYMRNALYLNTGTPFFQEAAYLAGLASSDWTWAVKIGDLDNDGWLDVFFTNGSARMFNHSDRNIPKEAWYGRTEWDLWEDTSPRREENLAFRNEGDLKFKNVSAAWGLGKSGMSYGCVYGDLDGDGDLDIVTADLDEPLGVYRNDSVDGHSVRIQLVGKRSNRQGIGAVVRLQTASQSLMRQHSPMTGFLSCNEPFLHFGLGAETMVTSLSVRWPSGVEQRFEGLKADRLYVIEEEGEVKPRVSDVIRPTFMASRTIPAITHVETPFDDFEREPLLAYQHSLLGPGMAVGDVDGDGDDDFYLSRAKGARRAVYLNEGKGNLTVKSAAPFEDDTIYEDMASLFVDVDRDGDLDLYVVSGSVECAAGDASLQDRLYLNDGKGAFSKAPSGALPKMLDSGSVVTAGDMDRDGDLDLFVGGRVVPGAYPVTPTSHLLANESTPGVAKFVDAADALAPGLSQAGLVTSAIWSDVDADGWLDLLVTTEWGPVKFYHNEPSPKGARVLIDRTAATGIADRLGWWNGIAGSDLDHDGDIDYVVTNFGLNTTYKATKEKPELLYYGDFDGTGKRQLVEAKYENGVVFPRRGLSCSSNAMPFVRDKLKTFHNFGLATLQDVYTESKLEQAQRFEANTLENGVLVNLGEGKLRFEPLPRMAQIAPAFGVSLVDADADGHTDALIAQNFFAPQVETGHMDGGLSTLLRGGPNEKDSVRWDVTGPRESGVALRGDAKGSAIVDFNEDGRPDWLVSVNSGVLQDYENLSARWTKNGFLKLTLKGPAGNPTSVGARVRLVFSDDAKSLNQLAEVSAGGSYLSQSTASLFFGCGDAVPTQIEVDWPNGKKTKHLVEKVNAHLVLSMP